MREKNDLHNDKILNPSKPTSIERVGHILQNIAFVCFVLSAPILVLFFLVSSKASAPSAFWGHLFYATLFIGIVGGHLGHFLINKKKNKHNDSADKESAGRKASSPPTHSFIFLLRIGQL